MEAFSRQFVIQQHTTPNGVHWDLMLEAENVLWTWRIRLPPDQISRDAVAVERIADHSKRFLKYEGPVQNQTGSVKIADWGNYDLKIRKGTWALAFKGHVLAGQYELILTESNGWTFRKTAPL